MSSKVGSLSTKTPEIKVIVRDFEPKRLQAPFFLRCGALLIDYLIFAIFPVAGLLLARLLGDDGSNLLNSDINNFAWLIAIIIGISNMLLLPMAAGQSLGKMIVGIRIITGSGERASAGKIALRQVIGYPLTLLTGGLGFLLSVFSSKGRSLHDLISGTVVVFADSRTRQLD